MDYNSNIRTVFKERKGNCFMTDQKDRGASALSEGVKIQFDEGITDYHLKPIVLYDENGEPVGRIKDGDSVIFALRRGEREIQLTETFTSEDFDKFDHTFVIPTEMISVPFE